MFLIALGIFVGIRKIFTEPAGSFNTHWLFIYDKWVFVFGELRRFILPIILIGSDLFFIFRPRREYQFFPPDPNNVEGGDGKAFTTKYVSEDYIDTTSIFGGTKKKGLF